MPFTIVRNDITKMRVDAIVNAAKPSLLGGGGVDGAIHAAAGPELLEEYRTLGGCKVGEAKCTSAYRLPCRYVIHTVGPKWHGGCFGEERALASCYRAVLALAKSKGCESVAFPLISAGNYGFPKDRAMRVAVETIGYFLLENDMDVSLVVYGAESTALSRKLFADVQEYIDEHYVEQRAPRFGRRGNRWEDAPEESIAINAAFAEEETPAMEAPAPTSFPSVSAAEATRALDSMFVELDESFQQMLLRKIDESGMSDAQCYKKLMSTASSFPRSARTSTTSLAKPQPSPLPSRWRWISGRRKVCCPRRATRSRAAVSLIPSSSISSRGAATMILRSMKCCFTTTKACWECEL